MHVWACVRCIGIHALRPFALGESLVRSNHKRRVGAADALRRAADFVGFACVCIAEIAVVGWFGMACFRPWRLLLAAHLIKVTIPRRLIKLDAPLAFESEASTLSTDELATALPGGMPRIAA